MNTFTRKTRVFFGTMICLMFVGIVLALVYVPIPEQNKITFDAIFGCVSTLMVMVFTYYFGSSDGSARKTDALVDRVNSDKQHEESLAEFLDTEHSQNKHKE